MPDFDPKDIPILDDIIEDEIIEDTENENEPDNGPDLFQDEGTADDITEDDKATAEAADDQNINSQPAPYQYEETYQDTDYQLDYEVTYDDLVTYEDFVELNQSPPVEPVDVELIVKSVVKQMMPDLEQQLRFLIQEALEKQLPAETVTSAEIDSKDP